ncbi:MAG: hypothetical protein NVS2B16_22200 [Chloroflexota bacterium]
MREEFTASNLHASTLGHYNWAPFDRVIAQERRAGLHVLGLLDYSNTWGYANHAWMPHGNIGRLSQDFARFAYRVAHHYRRQIRYWQVWNEPDLKIFWRPVPSPADYAHLLTMAYQEIKRASPHARVVTAGTSGMDINFVNQVAAHTRSFDIISVHPYRMEPEPQLLQQIRTLQRLQKPIWFSEVGWAAGSGCDLCVDLDAQARYLVRFYALAAAAGVQRVFWYDFRDDLHVPANPEAHFGLLRQDLSGKPAFAAFAFLSRLFRGSTFLHADSAGFGGVYALRFESPAGPFAVLWNLGAMNSTVALPWTPGTAAAYDLHGSPLESVAVAGGEASINLGAGGTPIYVLASPIHSPIAAPSALLHAPPRRIMRRHTSIHRRERVVVHGRRTRLSPRRHVSPRHRSVRLRRIRPHRARTLPHAAYAVVQPTPVPTAHAAGVTRVTEHRLEPSPTSVALAQPLETPTPVPVQTAMPPTVDLNATQTPPPTTAASPTSTP